MKVVVKLQVFYHLKTNPTLSSRFRQQSASVSSDPRLPRLPLVIRGFVSRAEEARAEFALVSGALLGLERLRTGDLKNDRNCTVHANLRNVFVACTVCCVKKMNKKNILGVKSSKMNRKPHRKLQFRLLSPPFFPGVFGESLSSTWQQRLLPWDDDVDFAMDPEGFDRLR